MNNDYNQGNDYTPENGKQQDSTPNNTGHSGFGEYRQSNPGFGAYQQSNPGFGEAPGNNDNQNGQARQSYTPPQYGQNNYGPAPAPNAGQSNATTSQTLGITSLVSSVICCCFPFIGLVLGILAIIFSRKATKANGGFSPSGATVGKICGIIAIVLCGLLLLTNLFSMITGFSDRFTEEFYQYYSGIYT